jgi:hypothetical protein
MDNSFATSLPNMSSLRMYWRNEREIKRAVRALTEFETLRDMGIRDRSQVSSLFGFAASADA